MLPPLANPNPGRVAVHRLNRAEYTAAIRDSAGTRGRRAGAALGRRCGSGGLRQRRQRAVGFAGAAGELPVRGAHDQPPGGWRSDAASGGRHFQVFKAAVSRRPDERRSAVWIAGRRADSLSLSAGCRVHHQSSVAAARIRLHRRAWASRIRSTFDWTASASSASRWAAKRRAMTNAREFRRQYAGRS